jgi:hypothetical protein
MKMYKKFNFINLIKIIICFTVIIFDSLFIKIHAQNNLTSNIKITNYGDLNNWAAHPWKKDLSDSISDGIIDRRVNDSSVDVFFIHPTTYLQKEFESWNADVNDIAINEKTNNTAILYQASAFNEQSRLFAPRYQQAHINSFYINPEIAKDYFDVAYNDVKAAFEFYLKNYNKGRPIIIASHSQGTKHAGRLLKEFFDNKPLQKQLVCAYLIGMPIPNNYFPTLKTCINENQTGCFVGWRTYKNGYVPELIQEENFKSIVVNPLTWDTLETFASSKLNKGGILQNFKKIVPGVVDAQVHHNVLWACKPNVFGKIFFTKKNFHIGDINLYYMNIRENVRTRIDSFKKVKNEK